MSKYLIIKRDECPDLWTSEGAELCQKCNGTGYIETQVDLLDALNEMKATEITCDCDGTHFGIWVTDSLLEWKCGDKIKRDVNA